MKPLMEKADQPLNPNSSGAATEIGAKQPERRRYLRKRKKRRRRRHRPGLQKRSITPVKSFIVKGKTSQKTLPQPPQKRERPPSNQV